MKVLVLGSTGLIGSTILRVYSESTSLEAFGTVRSESFGYSIKGVDPSRILTGIEVRDDASLIGVFASVKPDVVINCVGVTKHKNEGNQHLSSIGINSLFPHRLAQLCAILDVRLIHISTDCVFSGKKGLYKETDLPDADDVYGKSKSLGEVTYGNAITIRTSTIGHELNTNYGLLNWFLSQEDECKGFKNAIFSGLPTVLLAQVIKDYILNDNSLKGLYHIAASPINKYDLLKLIAEVYGKEIDIKLDEKFIIDRSLNSEKFNRATGFISPDWPELIKIMYKYQ